MSLATVDEVAIWIISKDDFVEGFPLTAYQISLNDPTSGFLLSARNTNPKHEPSKIPTRGARHRYFINKTLFGVFVMDVEEISCSVERWGDASVDPHKSSSSSCY